MKSAQPKLEHKLEDILRQIIEIDVHELRILVLRAGLVGEGEGWFALRGENCGSLGEIGIVLLAPEAGVVGLESGVSRAILEGWFAATAVSI